METFFQLFLTVSLLLRGTLSFDEQLVEEDVFISHLPDAHVMAHFEFKTTWRIHPKLFPQRNKVWHYGVFPKSLAEVVAHYHVQELHLALTQGKWRTRVWGYPPYSAPPGAELWAWFLPQSDVESDWAGLVNGMSGLVCVHLNAITTKSSYHPSHSFRPQGTIVGNVSSNLMRYGALPREVVCTENFTPWTKLLPCGSSAGLGTLFSSLVLFDTEYHSLGLHFEPVCMAGDCSDLGVQLRQTLTVVFPPAIRSGHIDWSLMRLFGGKTIRSACPLASRSRLLLAEYCPALGVKFSSKPQSRVRDGAWIVYNLAKETANSKSFNLKIQSNSKVVPGMPEVPVLTVQRYLSNSGRGWGGLNTVISNNHPTSELRVLYLDMVPWFCRLFMHTFNIENAVIGYKHYQPAKDRQRPHMLELLLVVPPQTTATISIEFNRAFLKWTEHPPDANHGFYINSAVITTILENCPNCTISYSSLPNSTGGETGLRVHTEALLIALPTPDFSMPYNVICFVCTVIAIGFGSIFNLVTRTLEPATDAAPRGLIPKLIALIRGWVQSRKKKTD